MKWPRISGNTYNNGIEVSNEMATMSNSDIDGVYKYYYSSNNNINRVLFMFMLNETSRDYTRNPWIVAIWPRMIGYVYTNNARGIAVSNETTTMLLGDI